MVLTDVGKEEVDEDNEDDEDADVDETDGTDAEEEGISLLLLSSRECLHIASCRRVTSPERAPSFGDRQDRHKLIHRSSGEKRREDGREKRGRVGAEGKRPVCEVREESGR